MKYFDKVNTGSYSNSGDAESLRSAFLKVNNNFKILDKGGIVDFHEIIWNDISDTKLCFDYINKNFKIVEDLKLWK